MKNIDIRDSEPDEAISESNNFFHSPKADGSFKKWDGKNV